MKILKVIAIEFFNFIDKFIHQPKILKVLKKKTKNINIFVDVGAHKGTYTDLIINNFDIKKTVMLEPQENFFNFLKEKYSKNDRVTILNKAVSSQEGSLEFFVPTGDDFSYGTSNKSLLLKNEILYKSIFVETTNLSEFHNQTFEIIKIDVEGSELDVLRTISNHLENCKFVFIEIMLKNRSQVYELLKKYKLIPISESKEDIGNYIFQKE